LGVRSIRFYDLLAVRHVEAGRSTRLLWPAPLDPVPTAAHLALASAWQDVNETVFTFVRRERGTLTGFAQATARPARDAWDLVRLAAAPGDARDGGDVEREQALADIVDELLEALLRATAGRGGLRVFARAEAGGVGQEWLGRRGFRRYTDEYTLAAVGLDVTPAPLPDHLALRARRPADAWGIFQLYCSAAPPEVRHAEGLSSKRWGRGSLAASTLDRLRRPREIVLDDEGMIVGWLRLAGRTARQPQRLEVMLHPRAGDVLPAFLAHAVVALEIRRDQRTVCQVRAYEDAVLHGLRRAGFAEVGAHALLVKHAAARVTERQLLLAALRAQSLGLDVSRYRQSATPRPWEPREPGDPRSRPRPTHSGLIPSPRVGITTLEHTHHD